VGFTGKLDITYNTYKCADKVLEDDRNTIFLTILYSSIFLTFTLGKKIYYLYVYIW
jgi:hypothetical protein